MHAKLWIDNGELVDAHLAHTNSMPKTRRGKSGKFSNLLGAGRGPRNKFALAQIGKGVLTPKLTRKFDSSHDGRKVVVAAEVVAIDHGGILKVVAGQTNGAFARGLHKGRRDREHVRWRSSKARGSLGRNHW